MRGAQKPFSCGRTIEIRITATPNAVRVLFKRHASLFYITYVVHINLDQPWQTSWHVKSDLCFPFSFLFRSNISLTWTLFPTRSCLFRRRIFRDGRNVTRSSGCSSGKTCLTTRRHGSSRTTRHGRRIDKIAYGTADTPGSVLTLR